MALCKNNYLFLCPRINVVINLLIPGMRNEIGRGDNIIDFEDFVSYMQKLVRPLFEEKRREIFFLPPFNAIKRLAHHKII